MRNKKWMNSNSFTLTAKVMLILMTAIRLPRPLGSASFQVRL